MRRLAMSTIELRQRFEALRAAVAAKDPQGVQAALEALEHDLDGADPLTRAAAYAQVQLERGRPLDAAQVLDDMLAVIGDDARVHHQIGMYREQGGDLDAALRSYARANAADAMFTEAWVSRGALLDRRDEPLAALRCYRSALLSDPQHVGAWRNMGNVLAAERKFGEAAAAYDTALGLAVGDKTIAFLRSSAHAAQGDLDTANRLLPESLQDELGRAVEVRVGEVVCRFFATEHDEARRRARARALLAAVDDGLPEGLHVVAFESQRYVCDPDPVRPAHPHRFFDASSAVAMTD